MAILVVLAASLLFALLRGGKLGNLADLNLRHLWLFFIPLALQLIVFSRLGGALGANADTARVFYVASLAVAALAVFLNRHLPGLIWIAAGLTCNFLVIALNGGFMPVWTTARQFAGMPAIAGRDNNVIPMTPQTVLPWLGDILPLPAWVPLANVFSLGDVLITAGGVLFIQRALAPAAPATTPPPAEN